MKKLFILIALCLFVAPLHADDDEDTSKGMSPAMWGQWQEAQMKHSEALSKYGKGSPEEVEAEVMMNTTARRLGIKPSKDVPESAPAPDPDADQEDAKKPEPKKDENALGEKAPQLKDATPVDVRKKLLLETVNADSATVNDNALDTPLAPPPEPLGTAAQN